MTNTRSGSTLLQTNIFLKTNDFPGGIGVWVITKPIYDTVKKNPSPYKGIHVHARKGTTKDIDGSFTKVYFQRHNEDTILEISYIDAISYTLTKWAGYIPVLVHCPNCKMPHRDEKVFSVIPHQKHICKKCKNVFYTIASSIASPLAVLDEYAQKTGSSTHNSDQKLVIRQKEFPGGVRIWTTHNPAIVKTFEKPEVEGIHIHCYDKNGNRVIDDTFGIIEIDNVSLSSDSVRTYSIQMELFAHAKALVSIQCPHCLSIHYDKNGNAYTLHAEHKCEVCGFLFITPTGDKNISNPLVEQLQIIKHYIGNISSDT